MTADDKDQEENVLCVSLVVVVDFCFCLLVSVSIILFPTKTFFVEILNWFVSASRLLLVIFFSFFLFFFFFFSA